MTEKLIAPLKPFDSWEGAKTEEGNQEAKEALISFYSALKETPTESDYRIVNALESHFRYLIQMLNIKRAFMIKNYMRVCNEIVALDYYQFLLQGRIYYNLLRTIEEEIPEVLAERCV